MNVLCIDVGGTLTKAALVRATDNALEVDQGGQGGPGRASFTESSAFQGAGGGQAFASWVGDLVAGHEAFGRVVDGLSLGFCGPEFMMDRVLGTVCSYALSWFAESVIGPLERSLATRGPAPCPMPIAWCNDVVALARGIEIVLSPGKRTCLLISAGTHFVWAAITPTRGIVGAETTHLLHPASELRLAPGVRNHPTSQTGRSWIERTIQDPFFAPEGSQSDDLALVDFLRRPAVQGLFGRGPNMIVVAGGRARNDLSGCLEHALRGPDRFGGEAFVLHSSGLLRRREDGAWAEEPLIAAKRVVHGDREVRLIGLAEQWRVQWRVW